VLVGGVVIGMDPHKRSATIEVLDEDEQPLMAGRFGTDREGYRLLLAAGRQFGQRVWAVEGCQGVGRHLAQRLVADGEPVVDVPAKLSARTRVFSTGTGPQDRRHRRPLGRGRGAADPGTATGAAG
jgi:transposase